MNRAEPLAAALVALVAVSLAACSTAASSSASIPRPSSPTAQAAAKASAAASDAAASNAACMALYEWQASGPGSPVEDTGLQAAFKAAGQPLSKDYAAWLADVQNGSPTTTADAAQIASDCAAVGIPVSPPSAPSASPSTSASTAAPSTSAPSLAGKMVATFSGSGIENTPQFTVTGTWKLSYSFDCSSFGYKGNFQVYEYSGSSLENVLVNDLAMSKSASTYAYGDAGAHHLEINSECSWSVKVIDEGS